MNDSNELVNPHVEESSLPTDRAAVSEQEAINYHDYKEEDENNLKKSIVIKHEFFVSHASISTNSEAGIRDPLSGEEKFVKSIVDELEEFKPKSTYVDYRDNPNFEFSIFHQALKTSKYGVFICSPRFKDRYINSSSEFITEEVKHFWTIKNSHHQPERLIPVMFGLATDDYDNGPFNSSDFMIDAEYGKITQKEMVKRVIAKIIEKVDS